GRPTGDDRNEPVELAHALASQETRVCSCLPRPSISSVMRSPLTRYGNFPPQATPAGVPVLMTSPGSSTRNWDRCQIRCATPKIMSAVVESWRGDPLTHDRRPSACGSTDEAGTSHGPSGLNVSQHLPFDHWPPAIVGSIWKSRSRTSLEYGHP